MRANSSAGGMRLIEQAWGRRVIVMQVDAGFQRRYLQGSCYDVFSRGLMPDAK